MKESIEDTIQGWRSPPSYVDAQESAGGPAGAVELTEDELHWVAGGTIIVFLCIRPGPIYTIGCTSSNPSDCEA
ncbi:hypothetical protein [Pseudonocardia cypriaca]|uniref:Mersacidin/lichenicidin family type 2 lantibiotic n=1 Tax=Pseudonocardia cypriaca TaxID=882449 RepID=A0A543FS85_9PSEU|nr:hypothetical protein [Pseudonocardia cypriaca]TQM36698.1 hypothetical protein FB388_3883 [Pseudonocardia cypriaca]